MKVTPMIFSTEHIPKLLDGSKTMTRRMIKPQPTTHLPYNPPDGLYWPWRYKCKGDPITREELAGYCPYGQVGDRLWVRETWWKPPFITTRMWKEGADTWARCEYEATIDTGSRDQLLELGWKKKPSIFMPRWASRITLEITELWTELLRSISPADAMTEGGYTVEEFIKLYLKINHLPDDASPWNWVISFKRIE